MGLVLSQWHYETTYSGWHKQPLFESTKASTSLQNLKCIITALRFTKSDQAFACPLGSWPLLCIQRKVRDRVPHGLVRVQTHTIFTLCTGTDFAAFDVYL
jgi:hypothetical protein